MNNETYHSILSAYMNAERSKLLEIASEFGPTDFPHAVMKALVQQLGAENAAPVALGIFRLLAGKDTQCGALRMHGEPQGEQEART